MLGFFRLLHFLYSSLSGSQTCDGHAEGGAGNVVQANLVAELDGHGVAAVLAADVFAPEFKHQTSNIDYEH